MKAESLQAIIVGLNEANVRYLVVGGLAVVAHGYVRYTVDVDLVVALNLENIRPALAVFERLRYRPRVPVKLLDFADKSIRESWIRDKGMVVFQLISDQHIDTNVDLFVSMPFDFDVQWRKADWQPVVGGVRAPVLALEELLTMKRRVDRSKDRIDVEALEKMHGLKRNAGHEQS